MMENFLLMMNCVLVLRERDEDMSVF